MLSGVLDDSSCSLIRSIDDLLRMFAVAFILVVLSDSTTSDLMFYAAVLERVPTLSSVFARSQAKFSDPH